MNKGRSSPNWFVISNEEEIPSPSLLVYPSRIEENIRRLVKIAGDPARLWTHVKTHKMSELVRMQISSGITRFKCATIAEAEMTASSGASDVILAMQPVGPNIDRFIELSVRYPGTSLSCIVDDEDVIRKISQAASLKGLAASVWLDINVGMNRTGVAPGENAVHLYKLIARLPMLKPAGLHVYDGHLHDPDFDTRKRKCDEAFEGALRLIETLRIEGYEVPAVVAGGTPTFPVHAKRKGIGCSPGTLLLWDYKSSVSFPDMDFLHAAVLLTRVVSRPAPDLVCIDLGHKAVAPEMPHPRVRIMGIDDYSVLNHSEEHMVIRTDQAEHLKPGDTLYCIPYHICPTCDRYTKATVVRDGSACGEWQIDAHTRMITV